MRSWPSGKAEQAGARGPLRERLDRLAASPFAHRGLHGPGRIENSRAAFIAAMDQGYGIELDVRVSGDGEAMVFHDADLGRLTGAAGPVGDRTAAALGRLTLRGSDETIPTLSEILELVGGRVPLLIELKAARRNASPLSAAVERALRNDRGDAAVMSFNPEVARWFARHAASRMRGLVLSERQRSGVMARIERALAVRRARPHFIACDVRDLPSRFAAARRRAGVRLFAWTVRAPADHAAAAAHADQVIFEA